MARIIQKRSTSENLRTVGASHPLLRNNRRSFVSGKNLLRIPVARTLANAASSRLAGFFRRFSPERIPSATLHKAPFAKPNLFARGLSLSLKGTLVATPVLAISGLLSLLGMHGDSLLKLASIATLGMVASGGGNKSADPNALVKVKTTEKILRFFGKLFQGFLRMIGRDRALRDLKRHTSEPTVASWTELLLSGRDLTKRRLALTQLEFKLSYSEKISIIHRMWENREIDPDILTALLPSLLEMLHPHLVDIRCRQQISVLLEKTVSTLPSYSLTGRSAGRLLDAMERAEEQTSPSQLPRRWSAEELQVFGFEESSQSWTRYIEEALPLLNDGAAQQEERIGQHRGTYTPFKAELFAVYAVERLIRTGGPNTMDHLIDATQSRFPSVRLAGLRAAIAIFDRYPRLLRSHRAEFIQLGNDPRAKIRTVAQKFLAETKDIEEPNGGVWRTYIPRQEIEASNLRGAPFARYLTQKIVEHSDLHPQTKLELESRDLFQQLYGLFNIYIRSEVKATELKGLIPLLQHPDLRIRSMTLAILAAGRDNTFSSAIEGILEKGKTNSGEYEMATAANAFLAALNVADLSTKMELIAWFKQLNATKDGILQEFAGHAAQILQRETRRPTFS